MAGMEPEKEDHEEQLEDVDRETTHPEKKRQVRDVDEKAGFLVQCKSDMEATDGWANEAWTGQTEKAKYICRRQRFMRPPLM
jgi:hypothetical protein